MVKYRICTYKKKYVKINTAAGTIDRKLRQTLEQVPKYQVNVKQNKTLQKGHHKIKKT